MSTHLLRTVVAGLLLLGLAGPGCEPEPDVEPLPCRNPEPGIADLGEGDLASGFLDLIDGEDLAVAFGPQGMHMVHVSSRVLGLEPAQAGGIGNRVSVAIRFEGEVVGGTVADMQPSEVQGDVSDFLGVRAIITAAEVDLLDQQVTDVQVIVRDGCGRELVAERPLRLVL
jgi:hypothetical protein